MVTPAARREVVAHLRLAFEVSERRACSTLGADRTIRYYSIRPDDAAVRARLRELAALPGLRVVPELDALIAARGRPAMCVSDNGAELTGMAILRWSQSMQVEWHYIAPGKPQQNAFIESFNGDCVTSCSTRPSSPRSPMSARRWQSGRTTTTLSGRTARSAICRPPSLPNSAFRNATGRGAALRRGLRAPPRCTTEPTRLK